MRRTRGADPFPADQRRTGDIRVPREVEIRRRATRIIPDVYVSALVGVERRVARSVPGHDLVAVDADIEPCRVPDAETSAATGGGDVHVANDLERPGGGGSDRDVSIQKVVPGDGSIFVPNRDSVLNFLGQYSLGKGETFKVDAPASGLLANAHVLALPRKGPPNPGGA